MPVDPDRLHRALGASIRAKREERGDSQGDLAKALGMSRASVVNIEAGRQRPPLATLYRIAQGYHVDVAALLPLMSEVSEGDVEERLIDAATGGNDRTREVLSAFVREVRSDYTPNKR